MSEISSTSELTTKEIVEQAISDYHATILPYLAKGNNGYSETPIGAMQMFDDDTAPSGWLVADGTVYDIDDYPFLANHIERVHGSKNYYGGNGTTTFAVPDWQGEFFRASGTNSHANQGSGSAVGEHQDATAITESFLQSDKTFVPRGFVNESNGCNIKNNDGEASYDAIRQASGMTFSSVYDHQNIRVQNVRPTNTSLLCCIKAVPAGMIFSTDEQYYGKWIDGSDVWWKVVEISGTIIGSTTPVTITRDLSSQLTNVNKIIDTRLSGENTNNHRFYQGYGGYMGAESPSSGYQGFSYTINSQMVIEISMMLNQVTLGNMKLIIFYTKTTD